MASAVAYLAENQSKARNLRCHIEVKAEAEPVMMSPVICDLIEKIAREKGVEPVRMASGAGHDTGIMVRVSTTPVLSLPASLPMGMEACGCPSVPGGPKYARRSAANSGCSFVVHST